VAEFISHPLLQTLLYVSPEQTIQRRPSTSYIRNVELPCNFRGIVPIQWKSINRERLRAERLDSLSDTEFSGHNLISSDQ